MRLSTALPSLLVLTSALLTACQGAGSAPPPAESGDFSLLLTSSNVTVASGSSTSVNVTVAPSGGFTKSVAFSTAAKPAALATTFAPLNSSTTTTLTLDASSLDAGTYDFFVKGTATVNGASVEHTAPLKLVVTPKPGITVTGRVLNAFGVPLSGASVGLQPNPASTTTDANGNFTFANVKGTYSLVVQPSGSAISHEFVGLTRPDPKLMLFGVEGGAPLQAQATVSGTLSGATFPIPAGQIAGVTFANAANGRGSATLIAGSGANYNLTATWTGSSATTGTLYALYGKLNPAVSTLFDSYSGFATRDVNLANGVSSSGQNITFQPLGAAQNSSLSALITLPSGASLTSKRLFLSLSPKSFFLLGVDTSANTTNTYRTPVVPGKTLGLVVDAKQGARTVSVQRVGLQPNEVVNLALPSAAALSSPTNGRTDVGTNPNFSWTSVPPSSVSIFLLSGKRVAYTTASGYQPLDSAFLGKNTSYTWTVATVGPFSSMDDFTSGAWPNGYPQAGDATPYVVTTSETFSFKTAP
ncbi:carboxypeptidase-like regulatory domain-containing protein [Deinococcus yavapaiensis]|uniref:Carboxypeptidase family protein n=1 Tax=Deinococcus yavapaiensis KR-236 TaxID=694435 RepID=A0A318SN88_9DEIO|nr:carboxypeptidase-like regulatory domain-containing protein [Deinococcus yavapaiensis]PYE54119.1 carboxypeptidase family protein [Deinococcus yavapaiensis KR-236]